MSTSKQKAFALFEAGAELGDAVSMGNLGWAYETGLGVAQDYAKAREWYEKAAAKDDADAMTTSARFTKTVRAWRRTTPRRASGTRRPPLRATRIAMTNLGLLYKGQGVAQDYAKAREWYEKAAAKDDAQRHEQPRRALRTMVTAWRRTTPRRASGTRRPLLRTMRTP